MANFSQRMDTIRAFFFQNQGTFFIFKKGQRRPPRSCVLGKTFYWLIDAQKNKLFIERFQRHELFAIENNFQ